MIRSAQGGVATEMKEEKNENSRIPSQRVVQEVWGPIPRGKALSAWKRQRPSARSWVRSPLWSKHRSTRVDAARAAASSWPRLRPKWSSMPAAFSVWTLATHQTGPEVKLVKKLLVEEGLPIAKELYLRCAPGQRDREDRVHGQRSRWYGHRGSGRQDAREDHQGLHRSSLSHDLHANELAFGLNLKPEFDLPVQCNGYRPLQAVRGL